MAEWKDVGNLVAGAAPVLAGILGGPAGAVVGAAGALAASFLGVEPEPDRVVRALGNPENLLRLKELESAEKERLLAWQEKQLEAERDFERELGRRHEADMASDSWLSKNVRPLCLLIVTVAIVAASLDTKIAVDKLEALTGLGWGIYGYYFLGRSAFDKGAVRLHMGAK
ncbi:hypothetical protein [Desulfovibrio ferrophilus]|uniref:Holin of 3TMs, for gene-transfer release n=1 Tax=Desulfovibrio ferrophilus TaxID=241368 RepID=A0A2Z6AZR0_9BACT|nr:hypothetical protein [Desulfovibrio ferrophilus]BBD08761.1 uncharacterized protein DFE_2035 [Desulfovibrio ferrophilus]